ncbi:MAG: hypothetical protein IT256_07490, partial [Chitinophagaceae bacterium]|nr:hypothetical protein [Chitinophagaceae bacterium]
MKTHLIITLLFCFQCARAQSPSDCFIENKGQIKNEMGRSREDIDFVLRSASGQTLLIGPGKLEYHFKSAEQQEQIVMKLKETNKAQIVAESKSDYYENYYL